MEAPSNSFSPEYLVDEHHFFTIYKMKKYLPLFFICLYPAFSVGQNLVPNPSFEEYTGCPTGPSDPATDFVSDATGWSTFSETPDYFNACADSSTGFNVPYGLPGYQQAADGNAFCGLITFSITLAEFREVIGSPLLFPLQIGYEYFVSFKVNTGIDGLGTEFLVANGIGVKFSTVSYSYNKPIPIDNHPQVYSSSIINDTANWVTVSGSFIADSAYMYVAIGNFFDNAHTDTIHLSPIVFRSYYYVDDVCISNSESTCLIDGLDQISATLFVISRNPAQEFIQVNSGNERVKSISIYSSEGQQLWSENRNSNRNNPIRIKVSTLPAGIYFIEVKGEKTSQRQKLLIIH